MRRLRSLVMAAAMLGLIALNVATLTVSSVFAALSGLVEAVDMNGSRAALRAEADRLAAENRRLVRERDRARARAGRLGRERTALARANRRLGAETRDLRQAADRLRSRVGRASARTMARAGRVAAANLAAMPFEAVPLVGVATIVGTTTFEMVQLCAMAREMTELRRSVGLETGGEDNAICGMQVPTARALGAGAVGPAAPPPGAAAAWAPAALAPGG